MLEDVQKNFIERIRRARDVKVIVNLGLKNQTTMDSRNCVGNVPRLLDEIADAIEHYWSDAHPKAKRKKKKKSIKNTSDGNE